MRFQFVTPRCTTVVGEIWNHKITTMIGAKEVFEEIREQELAAEQADPRGEYEAHLFEVWSE